MWYQKGHYPNFSSKLQASLILCCLGCAIFGITEVSTDGVEFDTGEGGLDPSQDISPPGAHLGAYYGYASHQPAEDSFVHPELDPEIGLLKPDLRKAPSTEPLATPVDVPEDSRKGYTGEVVQNKTDIDELD